MLGRSGAEEQVRFLEDLLGAPASSMSVAFVEALEVLGRCRVAVAATYPEDATQFFKEFLAAGGVEAVHVGRGIVGDDVASQTRQALKDPGAVSAAGGAWLDDAVRIGLFLTVEEDFAAMDEVSETFVYEPYPARKTVYAGLPEGPKVEIDTIAAGDKISGRT